METGSGKDRAPVAVSQDDPQGSYRARFEQSLVPQVFLDPRGYILEVNRAYCQLLGRAQEELVGRFGAEVAHPDDRTDTDRVLAGVLQGTLPSGQAERLLQHADGGPIPVLVSFSAIHDGDGQVLGIASTVQDLRAQRDAESRMQLQEDFYLAISQEATDVAIVADGNGNLVYASPAFTRRLGFELQDVVHASGGEFIHPEDRARNRAVFADVLREGGARVLTMRVRDAGGDYRWYECTYRNLLQTPVGGVVTNLRDVTERLEAERALRASEARYRIIADHADEGLWMVSSTGQTLYANGRLADILGVPLEEIYERTAPALFGAQGEVLRRKISVRRDVGPERYEVTYAHPDGTQRVLRFSAAPLPEDAVDDGSLGLITDITEARRLEEELRRAALHDSLTGLPNRALLIDRLEHALTREQQSTAVIFIDVDHFKVVNDARGHIVGDALLVAVAERLRRHARPVDTVARFGGDEFVVVCEDVTDVWAMATAETLLCAFAEPFAVGDSKIHASASIGVALSPPRNATDLLRNADTAMYAAKGAGRGGVRLFDVGLADEATERYQLAAELRKALVERTLRVHYQPVLDLITGEVLGVEALCRWTHPEMGAIGPSRFVPLAEEAGLARDLDRWVAEEALIEAARLRAVGALAPTAYVAVNLSPRSLADPTVDAHLLTCARQAGLDPANVVLEVTEGALMDDQAEAAKVLGRLRDAGFQVAIDDFGTGHSSLAYIDRFPITMLKIDRSFITALATDATTRAIVASVMDLGRAIGVDVIAEGIETEAQARYLRDVGCLAGQGWLWSAALPADEAARSGVLRRAHPLPDPAPPPSQ